MRRLILCTLLSMALLAASCGDDSGGGGGDFCDFISSFDEQNESLDSITDPEDVERVFSEIEDQLDEAVSRAPGEIKDDVEKVAEGIDMLVDFLRDNEWNFLAAAFSAESDPRLAALDDPEFNAASDRVTDYCGIDDDSNGFDGDTGLPDDDGDTDLPDDLEFDPPDFSDVDFDDERAIAIAIYEGFGHDRETAECLADELGAFEELGDEFDLSTTFCGLTVPEIVARG